MSKIYIVTDGDYSDYRIVGASTSKEAAERIKTALGADYLEEFEDGGSAIISPGLRPFFVKISMLGVVHSVGSVTNPYDFQARFDWDGNISTGMWAQDTEHAIKIANERRAQLVALDAWEDEDRLKDFPWSNLRKFT